MLNTSRSPNGTLRESGGVYARARVAAGEELTIPYGSGYHAKWRLFPLLLSTPLSSPFTWRQGHVLGGHHGDTDGGGVDQRIGAQQQRVERLQHANKACPPKEHPLCFSRCFDGQRSDRSTVG